MNDVIKMEGGNSNQVIKSGNSVIRNCGVWSPFIHRLLRYLDNIGFQEAPKLLKVDNNQEVLSYIQGEVGNYPLIVDMLTDKIVVEAAKLLRKFHDATSGFVIFQNDVFQLPVLSGMKHEVICHNDFAPYNCVFSENKIIGMIDFDTASPGTRIWDIAYAVYRFIPFSTDTHCQQLGWKTMPDRTKRLKLFCDSYQLIDREHLMETVIRRIEYLIDYMQSNSLNAEHIPFYHEDLAYIKENKKIFEHSLAV